MLFPLIGSLEGKAAKATEDGENEMGVCLSAPYIDFLAVVASVPVLVVETDADLTGVVESRNGIM